MKSKLAELGIEGFYEVKAKRMIEDWFLEDLLGLCKFLKLTPTPKKIEGKDRHILYTRGSVHQYQTYPGMYIPAPLK